MLHIIDKHLQTLPVYKPLAFQIPAPLADVYRAEKQILHGERARSLRLRAALAEEVLQVTTS